MKVEGLNDLPLLVAYLEDECVWVDPLNFYNRINLFHVKSEKICSGLSTNIHSLLGLEEPENEIVPYKRWNFTGSYRYKQKEFVDNLIRFKRGIGCASPGFGKTVAMTDIVCRLGVKTLIISENKEPFMQIVNTLTNLSDIPEVGHIGSGKLQFSDVCVGMRQTLAKQIKAGNQAVIDYLNEVELVIVDECHHGVTQEYLTIYDQLKSCTHMYGVSATPYRDDYRTELLLPIFGPIRYTVDFGDAVDNDILCPLTVITRNVPRVDYPAPVTTKEVKSLDAATGTWKVQYIPLPLYMQNKLVRDHYRYVYENYIIRNDDRNIMGAQFAQAMVDKDKSCVLIVSKIEHAKEIQKHMPSIVMVHGQMSKKVRADVFAKLQTHEIKAVVSTLFDEAVDIPSLDAVGLMAGGASTVKTIQRLRSTRLFTGIINGKDHSKIRGFVFYPIDDTVYLKRHSQATVALLRKEMAKSERNEWKSL